MADIIGGSRKKNASANADIYFDIKVEKIRNAVGILNDNVSATKSDIDNIKEKIDQMENLLISIEARI